MIDGQEIIQCKGDGCVEEAEPCSPIGQHWWARYDAYGIFTGLYCDKCYESNYPYRKDMYAHPFIPERLDDE